MRKTSKASSPSLTSRALRQQQEAKRRRRHRLCLLLVLLLAVGGFWLLRRLPFTLTEISRAVRQSFSAAQQPAPPAPPPALRGTIYDRHMEELAVSYQLHTLRVHPAELPDRQEAARLLALAVGAEAEDFQRRLESKEPVVELIIGIDAAQAQAAESLELPGVSCLPVEVRYYPGHAAAGRLLGFVSEGTGLSGAEALYDPLLQPGAFRPAETEEINFAGETHLGPQAADILLTLDLKLQKRLEEELEAWRRRKGAASGSAVVLDPETGRLLVAVRQPGLDPNYFWQTSGQALPKEDGPLFPAEFRPDLLHPLLAAAAAAQDAGPGGQLLPLLITPQCSLSPERLAQSWHEFGFDQPAPELLPFDQKLDQKNRVNERDGLSAADIAAGAAALLNSGKRIAPWLLKAVYDPDRQRFYSRDLSAAPPQRLLAPAAGVQLRRSLLHDSPWSGKDGFLYLSSTAAATVRNGWQERHLQDVLIAAVPQEQPRLLLVMAVDYGFLYPQPPDLEPAQDKAALTELGRRLLELLTHFAAEDTPPDTPPLEAKNEANLRRFLLSRRFNQPAAEEKFDTPAPQVMPDLIGLSLRQGLRRLNPHKLRVGVRGSGRIVAQKPAAKTSLAKIETCELTLEPFPHHEKPAPAAAKPASRTERKNPARKSGQPDTPNKP
ncbi:MAG: PASTA domain-containing protein [Candidatus Electronema sp. V4]|uniref:PASTA domain-containing protein n=1 Tax=Candidatus Electronema sp. V4 TaxID=3454756 RepID=UPI004055766E